MPSPLPRRILSTERRRRLPSSGFGWIDRRLLTQGILKQLPWEEHILYTFLCIVADQNGVSFYGDRRICEALRGMNPDTLDRARRNLEHRGLILYRHPYYQVLELPSELGPAPLRSADEQRRATHGVPDSEPRLLGDILRKITERDQGWIK